MFIGTSHNVPWGWVHKVIVIVIVVLTDANHYAVTDNKYTLVDTHKTWYICREHQQKVWQLIIFIIAVKIAMVQKMTNKA